MRKIKEFWEEFSFPAHKIPLGRELTAAIKSEVNAINKINSSLINLNFLWIILIKICRIQRAILVSSANTQRWRDN